MSVLLRQTDGFEGLFRLSERPKANELALAELEHVARVCLGFNAVAAGGGTDPATMQDAAITLDTGNIICAQTASTATGSTCNVVTSYNAFHPGLIKDGKRLNEEIFGDMNVYDGGADGDANTLGDNTVFLRPGIFIP